jgi:hypothetical protein
LHISNVHTQVAVFEVLLPCLCCFSSLFSVLFLIRNVDFESLKQFSPLVALLQTVLQEPPQSDSRRFTWRQLYDSFGISPLLASSELQAYEAQAGLAVGFSSALTPTAASLTLPHRRLPNWWAEP